MNANEKLWILTDLQKANFWKTHVNWNALVLGKLDQK